MAIPAAVMIVVLVSLAINTEGRGTFINRQVEQAALGEEFNNLDNTRIIIQTEDGAIELSSNGERVIGQDGDGEYTVLTARPDANGDIVGFRVNDDGTFEPIRPGEDTTGDTIIVPNAEGGFDLVRPDGTRTQLSVDENGNVAALDENGNPIPLDRDGNGNYDLGGGLTADEATVNEQDRPLDDQALPDSNSTGGGGINWRNILIVLLGFVGLAGTVWWFFAMRPNATTYLPPATVPAASGVAARGLSPWEAFEAYLSELAANPDPTQAIRLAYAYAEQGVGRLPARHGDQTPHEWHRSITPTDPEIAQALWPLTERYAATRFADHAATPAERDAALNELRSLVHMACS